MTMSVTAVTPECQSLRDNDITIIVLLTILFTSLTSCILMKLIAYYLNRKGYRLHPKSYDRRNKSYSTAPVKSVILWDTDKSVALVKTRLVIVSELPTETEKSIEKDLSENELLLLEPHQVANQKLTSALNEIKNKLYT